MGKTQRDKGKRFEQQVARLFRTLFPASRRNLEYQGELAELGTDVTAGPFRIQCKHTRRYVSISKIEQVDSANGIPVLIAKGDYKQAVAVVYLDEFMRMLAAMKDAQETVVRMSMELYGKSNQPCGLRDISRRLITMVRNVTWPSGHLRASKTPYHEGLPKGTIVIGMNWQEARPRYFAYRDLQGLQAEDAGDAIYGVTEEAWKNSVEGQQGTVTLDLVYINGLYLPQCCFWTLAEAKESETQC